MNKFQQHLYNKLYNLVNLDHDCGFYYDDVEFRGNTYRVFQYRMLGIMDASQTVQLECRGTMFRLEDDTAVELVSLAPQKFFNLNENKQSQGLDYSKVLRIMVKYDGSLMSTVKVSTGLYLKSKGRFESVMANDANLFLARKPALFAELEKLMKLNMTCNMEWISPNNRIVLPYKEEALVAFNIRDNKTGQTFLDPPTGYPEIAKIWAENLLTLPENTELFIAHAREEEGIEGYVMVFDVNGAEVLVKLKTLEYVGLHRIADLLDNQHSLFNLALENKIDDVIGGLPLQPDDITRFLNMQEYVVGLIESLVNDVERFLAHRGELSQKELAIAARQEFGASIQFTIVMKKHHTGVINYDMIKEQLRRKWRDYINMPPKR